MNQEEFKKYMSKHKNLFPQEKNKFLFVEKGNRKNSYVAISRYKEIDQDYLYYNYNNILYQLNLNEFRDWGLGINTTLRDYLLDILAQKEKYDIEVKSPIKLEKPSNNYMWSVPLVGFSKIIRHVTTEKKETLKEENIAETMSFLFEEDLPTTNIEDVIEGISDLLQKKNKAYGESALKPLNIFAKYHKYGERIDEKLARIVNQENPTKEDKIENLIDIVGGIVLILKDLGYNKNFNK